MKAQVNARRFFYPLFHPACLSVAAALFICLLSAQSFSQAVITSANTTYKLPDVQTLQSPEAARAAVTTAELAGQALMTDAANEHTALNAAQNDLNKVQPMKTDYLAALNNYTKNGYDPYMADFNNYTPNLNRYNDVLSRHNTAVAANNALAPEQRSAANVASLNSEKTELDTWHGKLDTWKSSLDDAKAKLDAQRAVLLDQKRQYETAFQAAFDKVQASQLKLKGILDQLIICANYADKCRALLSSKFNYTYTGAAATGFFGSPVYRGSLADLNTDLERLKNLSSKPWDGN